MQGGGKERWALDRVRGFNGTVAIAAAAAAAAAGRANFRHL